LDFPRILQGGNDEKIDCLFKLHYTVHMCTAKIISKNNKIENKQQRLAKIIKLGQVIFHASDLANLWQINNANTLHTTLKRYARAGLLFRIYRGFYSLKPIAQLDPLLLGVKALHEFSYVSAETMLERAGVISQSRNIITLISSKSKQFSIGNYHYRSRKLAAKHLFNPAGITEINGIKIAGVSRAAADILYFNPRMHFDAGQFIKWREVKKLQAEIGYKPIKDNYDYTKSKRSRA